MARLSLAALLFVGLICMCLDFCMYRRDKDDGLCRYRPSATIAARSLRLLPRRGLIAALDLASWCYSVSLLSSYTPRLINYRVMQVTICSMCDVTLALYGSQLRLVVI